MQQYVVWANATGTVQQFYTDSTIQVRLVYLSEAFVVKSMVLSG